MPVALGQRHVTGVLEEGGISSYNRGVQAERELLRGKEGKG